MRTGRGEKAFNSTITICKKKKRRTESYSAVFKWYCFDVDRSSWDVKDVQLLYCFFPVQIKICNKESRELGHRLHTCIASERKKISFFWRKKKKLHTHTHTHSQTHTKICFLIITLYIYMQNEHVHADGEIVWRGRKCCCLKFRAATWQHREQTRILFRRGGMHFPTRRK